VSELVNRFVPKGRGLLVKIERDMEKIRVLFS